ncbi:MAG: sensor histidine kinase [Candidatus Paceibacterota bacterium]|jgi:signal transduction histidine kinase
MGQTVGGKPFRSLNTTLAFTLFIFAATLLLTFGFFSVYSLFVIQQESVNEQQTFITREAGNTVKSFIEEKIGTLERISRLYDVVDMDPADQKEMLEKLMGSESAFRQLAVLDDKEEEMMSVARQSKSMSGDLKDRAGDEMFPKIKVEGIFISPVYIGEVTSEPMVTVAVPVKNIFGDFRGALLAEVNLKFMWDLMDKIEIGETGLAYVVDRDGRLIAFENTSLVLRGENLGYLKEVEEFTNNPTGEHEDISDISKGINGDYVVTNHSHLETPDWAVIAELPVWEAYGPLAKRILLVFGGILFIFGIAVSVVVFISRRITRPIIGLRDAAAEIGDGNLEKHIAVETGDEVGQLAETFNLMTDKLKDQKEREAAVSKMKSEFISIVAHQLRTPLSGLKWTFDMVADGSLGRFTKKQKEHFENCEKANEKMIDTINDLLDLTRIEEGRFLYKYSDAKIADLVEEAVGSLKMDLERKDLSIVFQKPDNIPTLTIDSEKIVIAIRNMLENAIKYSRRGGKINVSLIVNSKEVVFKVEDMGIGIPKDQQNRIFEKFFRAENATDTEPNGSGLGLYISNNIIKKHGGNMWFESEEEKGTTFYFSLPLKQ